MPKLSFLRGAGALATLFVLLFVPGLIVALSPTNAAAAPVPPETEAATAPSQTNQITGTVLFSDRTLCHYNSAFFDVKVFPLIEPVDGNGNLLPNDGPNSATALGLYDVWYDPAPVTTTTNLRVTCEGTVVTHKLTADEIASGHADIVLPNRTPVANPITAKLNGLSVVAVPGGSTIKASVTAVDPDGDPLHYKWGAGDGTAVNADAPETTWTLPVSRGLHFLYVLISDGKGGYVEKQLALTTGVRLFLPLVLRTGVAPAAALSPVAMAGSVLAPAAALKPSDHAPANDHFLTFPALSWPSNQPAKGVIGPLDNRVSACNYYRDLGVIDDCTADGHPTGHQLTFSEWKAHWRFGAAGNNEAHAKYANLADLNLQRDMHTLSESGVPRPDGSTGTDVASYVCNYPNTPADPTLGNVLHDVSMVACVSFEYSVTKNPKTGLPYNNGQPFTKFLTFGPTGDLLLSVNLDGRGEKFIPGACVACHGGSSYSGQYGVDPSLAPNLGAQFIPYDLDNYAFSNQPGYTRADQEAQLRLLNQFVLDTGPYSATIELIDGWYANPSRVHNGSFIPPAWSDTTEHTQLYEAVVKPQCRMCHLALDPSFGLNFGSPTDFDGWIYYVGSRTCGVGSIQRYFTTMPNAKETFDRFWNSINGLPGVDQPALLLAYLKARDRTITTCKLPSWLP